MISAVVSARVAGLDRIKSGLTWRFANRLPIFGASRLPRSFNGRSLSANAGSSRLDLAWRMRNSVFMRLPKAMRSQSYRHQTFQRVLPEPGMPGTNVPRLFRSWVETACSQIKEWYELVSDVPASNIQPQG